MTELIHLSFEEAFAVYARVMELTDSKPVIRDVATLEHILLSCGNSFNGEKDVILFKSAYLIKEIISKHPFMDGNKRAANAIADTFLALNGFELHLTVDDIKFFEEIDFKKLRVGTVKKFLEKKVRSNE